MQDSFCKFPIVPEAWVRQRASILCLELKFGQKQSINAHALKTPAAKITRHLPDTINIPTRFDQSRTRIDFE